MPRDYKKEFEWQRSKYKQVAFMVSHEVADMLKKHLAAHGIKPVDWFRYVVSLGLVPPMPGEVVGADAVGDVGADVGDEAELQRYFDF